MQHPLRQRNTATTGKGLISALLLASMFAATSGCLQQSALTQGYRTTQPGQPGQVRVVSANTPCTPSATSDLITIGRSLLDITTSLIKTRNQMSNDGSVIRDIDDTQRADKGHAMLDSIEGVTDGPQQPYG